MNNGQRVAKVAVELATPRRIVEKGTNTDYGGWIDDCERFWGMGRGTSIGAQPWCGMGADKIFRLAKVDDSGVCHPATAEMCRRADRLGGLEPKGPIVIPGCVIVRCSVHVETVVHDRGGGILDTVGCNTSDSLMRNVRDRSWGRVFELPGLREGEPEPLVEYWFEDPRFDPVYFGGYDTRARREAKIDRSEKLTQADKEKRIRRVREKDGEFGFFLFSGHEWTWGPWISKADGWAKEARNDRERAVSLALYGEPNALRSRSRRIARTEEDVNFAGTGETTEAKTT